MSQEYQKLHDLNKKKSTVLVVGAGFIGVEWVSWHRLIRVFAS